MEGSLISIVVILFISTQSSAPKALHLSENQTHSYQRSSAATGNGLKQCSELILMSSGQHPCSNYTSHIRPRFARVPPLNLFACIMRDLNKRLSFINAVIYIYDQCAFEVPARRQRAQDDRCLLAGTLTGLRGEGCVPLESDKNKTAVQTPQESV